MRKKWEIKTITSVEPTNDFRLICVFDDGTTKDFDMKPVLRKKGPMIEPLQKITFFKKVFLEMGTPTWPNGFDLCCDSIYAKAKPLKLAA